jgi:hypothetical protein
MLQEHQSTRIRVIEARPRKAAAPSRRREMKLNILIVGLCVGGAIVASGQVMAQTVQTETKYVTVDGDVVRYEPGRTIVIRGADNKEIVYTLSPKIAMPTEVKVGRRVTLYTEAAKDGSTQLVTRVTTTSVNPEGSVKKTTEDTRVLPSGTTTKTTTTTNTFGKVAAYEAGKTLTVTRSDGSKVTYLLNEQSKVPVDLVIGKSVSILPLANTSPGEPVAHTITYVTTTTKTETIPEP